MNTKYQIGKLENLEKERTKLGVVGVSEVRWKDSGSLISGGWIFYYSAGVRHEAAVRLMLRKKLMNAAVGCWHVSERVIMVKIAANLSL